MAEELIAKSCTRVSALDKARYVNHHESVSSILDDPEYRFQRRERVAGHLRPRRTHRRQQTRLARVRCAYYPNIREQLQFKTNLKLLSRITLLGQQGKPVGRRREPSITAAPPTTLGDEDALTMVRQVSDAFTCTVVPNLGTLRHNELCIIALLAMFLSPRTATAVSCPIDTVVSKTQQGANVPVTNGVHTTAISTIPTIGSTVRHELLAPPAHSPISPIPTECSYLNMVYHRKVRV